ncbi:MAG: aminodeoxychorismate synthase component I [Candidatus Thiodiazotropha sp. (ex Ctena orbiculata)]|uniref:aminodeoxychorismate synthase n=1 Tax=Candidatus Thiodiazotropha taylori TaxID=2792791 RepID=A0A944MBN3_9GAMM|nr:aminodeoxychorismate synthase component I [Candidatus Thiodiazotropha taylori]MBT2990899.1 aminodeoxychorismate synthase component I [Candidatus Thiodiazotropha taylori]MBT2996538.1 aminodeoxychorismate synthase component I [Candidatus Thiodiazotropha taylori]MBT3000578.1 aminodeoxychorismate synthase component I [Candidatus Thiodiazotropha taylori]MBV2106907.1 aminodeoxychorismate synthase component I [Candidatus Thiodiazotropha taylori]
MSAVVIDFPYREDSAQLFEALAHQPWAAFLDSGRPHSEQGRYDIISADPDCVLVTRGEQTRIQRRDGTVALSTDDPFQLLREALGPIVDGIDGIPFCGGAIGYFGYDLGRRLERLPSLAEDMEQLPDMAVGIHDWSLVVDHQERRSRLVGQNPARLERYRRRLLRAAEQTGKNRPAADYRVLGEVCSNMTREEYLASIARIKRYILDGDCYQVNFAQRFSAAAEGDPWHAYSLLRQLNAAPFAAYMNTPYCQVLSTSPERFLEVRDGLVETKPIKGTAPRGEDPIEDMMLAEMLKNSPKDQAENLMIVDLLRNDLGKVCATGSVEVPELFKLESYARVHHLVSKVQGTLAPGKDALSLMRACFPGGSITGAPKLRSMEIIEELEPHRRGVYCGSIGYIGFNGDMDSNIAIRTLVHSDGITRLWAGGGIVADSDPEAEYRETYHKASALLDLLQRMEQMNSERCG